MYSNPQEIAEKIKETAKTKKLSVREILIKAELSTDTMKNYKTSMPRVDNLGKIAEILDCSIDYLLGRTENPEINR